MLRSLMAGSDVCGCCTRLLAAPPGRHTTHGAWGRLSADRFVGSRLSPRSPGRSTLSAMLEILRWAGGAIVLYWVVRLAVEHAILGVDRRRAKERRTD